MHWLAENAASETARLTHARLDNISRTVPPRKAAAGPTRKYAIRYPQRHVLIRRQCHNRDCKSQELIQPVSIVATAGIASLRAAVSKLITLPRKRVVTRIPIRHSGAASKGVCSWPPDRRSSRRVSQRRAGARPNRAGLRLNGCHRRAGTAAEMSRTPCAGSAVRAPKILAPPSLNFRKDYPLSR